MIEEDLYSYISNFPGLVALVQDRIFPLVIPEDLDTYPVVTFNKVSRGADNDVGFAHPRFQFSSWSNDYLEAKKVAEQIKLAFKELGIQMGTQFIFGNVCENEVDLYEPETKLYHVPVDITFWHEE